MDDVTSLAWRSAGSSRLGAERGRGRGPYGGVAAAPARAAPNRRSPRASSSFALDFLVDRIRSLRRPQVAPLLAQLSRYKSAPGSSHSRQLLPCRGAALLSAAVRPPDPPTGRRGVDERVGQSVGGPPAALQLPLRAWPWSGAGEGTCFFHLIVDRPFDRPEDYKIRRTPRRPRMHADARCVSDAPPRATTAAACLPFPPLATHAKDTTRRRSGARAGSGGSG